MWAQAEDLVGTTLEGRYKLDRLMGEGGMGAVYAGRNLKIDKRVAIKVLSPQLAQDERQRKRFLREARAANRIASEHVVEILDFGEDPTAFFVMEYLDGQDLSGLIRQEGIVPWARAKQIMLEITTALAAAHHEGIVHRDIKPSNVFLISKGDNPDFVKVLDFGIAKLAESDPEAGAVTRTNEVIGTVSYMAPEQALGQAIDHRTDIYALGVVLFELLSGQVPYTGTNEYQVIDKHVRHPPPTLSAIVPSAPEQADAVILRAMAKNPADRFATMEEFAAAIQSIPVHGEGPLPRGDTVFLAPPPPSGPSGGPPPVHAPPFMASPAGSTARFDMNPSTRPGAAQPRREQLTTGPGRRATTLGGDLEPRGPRWWMFALGGVFLSLLGGGGVALWMVQGQGDDPSTTAQSTVTPPTSPEPPAPPERPLRVDAPADPPPDPEPSAAEVEEPPAIPSSPEPVVEPEPEPEPEPVVTHRTPKPARPSRPRTGRTPKREPKSEPPSESTKPPTPAEPPSDRVIASKLARVCGVSSEVTVSFQVMTHGRASLVKASDPCLEKHLRSATFAARPKPVARSFACDDQGCH